jgi:hypothetical protein
MDVAHLEERRPPREDEVVGDEEAVRRERLWLEAHEAVVHAVQRGQRAGVEADALAERDGAEVRGDDVEVEIPRVAT